STVPVEKGVETLVTSGAKGIGTSGAALSGLRAHEPQLSLWSDKRNPTANLESNKESNFSSEAHAHPRRGASAARSVAEVLRDLFTPDPSASNGGRRS
ncbi:replication protein A, partial [Agrobacterium sp. NPDC090283]